MATRAEMRRPGTLERTFGGLGGGGQVGFGGLLAGSFMSSLAGTVIGSMVARQFFAHDEYQQQGLGPKAVTIKGRTMRLRRMTRARRRVRMPS